MTSRPLEVRVPITELPMLVEKKSKQTDLNDTPEPMSLPINDLPLVSINFKSQILSSYYDKKNLVLNGKPKTYFLFDYSLPQNGTPFPKIQVFANTVSRIWTSFYKTIKFWWVYG